MKSQDALVILSGGLDSTTALYWAKERFKRVHTLTFSYGQSHSVEVERAVKIAERARVASHRVLKVNLDEIGGSALTQSDIPIPTRNSAAEVISNNGIPVTYVPFRNGIFLSIAAAYAEVKGISHLVGGWNAVDYSGYPDCRREFLNAMERALTLGSKAGVEGRPFTIHAPLISLSKAEIIALGLSLGADYSLTVSCYRGQEPPCGNCDSCVLRADAWRRLGLMDHAVERVVRLRSMGGRD
jgi:7-cyano-7-deazaguanine synthase